MHGKHGSGARVVLILLIPRICSLCLSASFELLGRDAKSHCIDVKSRDRQLVSVLPLARVCDQTRDQDVLRMQQQVSALENQNPALVEAQL